jgi:hypothetical protein
MNENEWSADCFEAHQDSEKIAVLVNCTPQIVLLALESEE